MIQFHWSLVKSYGDHEQQGTFWISTNVGDFPCRGWKDVPLTNLLQFVSEAYDIFRTPYIKKRNIGFDPYYVLLDSSQPGLMSVHFLRSYVPQPLIKLPTVILPLADFNHKVLDAGYAMIETYRSGEFGTPMELQLLKQHMKALSSAIYR